MNQGAMVSTLQLIAMARYMRAAGIEVSGDLQNDSPVYWDGHEIILREIESRSHEI
jgi:hypothetical protein